MSHFIGLVFVNTNESNIDFLLEPYGEQTNAKWDWYAIGNRWDGYLFSKDGHGRNELKFDDVDWDEMFKDRIETYTNLEGKEVTCNDPHVPFCLVTTDGDWHERGEMGWFGISVNDKEEDVWNDEVKSYVKNLANLPEEERNAIVVYAVDFHV